MFRVSTCDAREYTLAFDSNMLLRSTAGKKKSPPHTHGPHKGATEIDVSLWYSEIGLDNNFVVELRKSFRGECLIISALGAGKI